MIWERYSGSGFRDEKLRHIYVASIERSRKIELNLEIGMKFREPTSRFRIGRIAVE